MSSIKRRIADFKESRGSRKFSIILIVILLVISQIVSILSIIVIADTVDIITRTYIPNGYAKISFDYTQPDDMEVSIPYFIDNPGITDLTNIIISIKLYANYTHNSTRMNVKREIFFKEANIGICKAGKSLNGTFNGGFSYYNISNLILFLEEADPVELFWILADINVNARYFANLINFNIITKDLILI